MIKSTFSRLLTLARFGLAVALGASLEPPAQADPIQFRPDGTTT